MKKVYTHDDPFMVTQIKQKLEHSGIECFLKNEYAAGAIGELSPFDTMPEVWINDELYFEKAQKVIAETLAEPRNTSPWICAKCSEANEASFEICWQCGFDPVSE